MNKKVIFLILALTATGLTLQVMTEEDSQDISRIKEKIKTRNDSEVPSPKTNLSRSSFSSSNELSEKRFLPEDNFPDTKAKVEAEEDATIASEDKKLVTKKRLFPRKSQSTATDAPDEKSLKRKSSPAGAEGGTNISSVGKTRVFNVTENGGGDSYLLLEALRLLNSGDKIQLQKGQYSILISHLTLPDFEITGQGDETILELPETLKLQRNNIVLKNLKLLNTSTSVGSSVTAGKNLTLDNVTFDGNGNDCLRVTDARLSLTNIRLNRCNRGIHVKNATGDFSQIEVSDSDYAVFFEGGPEMVLSTLKADTVNLFSIFFSSDSTGNVTCQNCRLGDNHTNLRSRLIIKPHSP